MQNDWIIFLSHSLKFIDVIVKKNKGQRGKMAMFYYKLFDIPIIYALIQSLTWYLELYIFIMI